MTKDNSTGTSLQTIGFIIVVATLKAPERFAGIQTYAAHRFTVSKAVSTIKYTKQGRRKIIDFKK